MLGQFRALAAEFLEAALAEQASRILERQGDARGDSQGREQGLSRAAPASACWASRPTATSRCATGSPGRTSTRSARAATASIARRRATFLEQHHIDDKTDCSDCWARPLCSGGCYHEAHTRYGDTTHANLHFCEWIRGWTDVCLQDLRRARRERNPDSSRSSTATRPERRLTWMTSPESINRKATPRGRARRATPTQRRRRAAGRGRRSSRSSRTFRSGAPSCSRRAGKPTAPAAPPACASRSSATCSTATSAASGRPRCPTAEPRARLDD